MAQSETQQPQFQQIFDALASKFPDIKNTDGESTVFQFAGSPLEATWQDGTDIAAYDTANSVSQSLGGFYTPGSGSLADAYGDLIMGMQPANRASNPQYADLMQQRDDQRNLRDAATTKLANAWASYVQQNTGDDGKTPQNESQWEADPIGGGRLMADYNEAVSDLADTNKQIAALVHALDGPLGRAQAGYNDPNNRNNYTDPDNSQKSLPRIDIAGSLAKDKLDWDRNTTPDFHVTLKGKAETKTPWKTVYKVAFHQHCLSTSTDTTVDTSRIITDEAYQLDLTMRGLKSYAIKLGSWYDPSYVNPATAKFPPGSTVNNDTFFGLNGSLHLIPDAVWVSYKPKIELTVTTDTYKQEFETRANAGINWIDLFSFRFRIDSLAALQPVQIGNTTKITFDAPVYDSPQILGMTSSVRYNGDSK